MAVPLGGYFASNFAGAAYDVATHAPASVTRIQNMEDALARGRRTRENSSGREAERLVHRG